MSARIVLWIALVWCTARLLRAGANARRFRLPTEHVPSGIVRNTVALTVLAWILAYLLIGAGRPGALIGTIVAFALLGVDILRRARSTGALTGVGADKRG